MTSVQILVPTSVNLSQYTDVQRGTIFMFFVTILIVFISSVIRIVSNQLDPNQGENYQDKQGGENKSKPANQSELTFDRDIIKSQTIEEEDTGTTRFIKKMNQFNTVYVPFLILFALNFVCGVTYAFDMCLFFFTLLPLILFNLTKLHRKCIDHKVFIVLLENIWLILAFFWIVNIWATGRWVQPYYKI